MSRNYFRFAWQSMRHFERRAAWLLGHAARDEFSANISHRACSRLNEDEAQICDEMAQFYREELFA